MGETLGMYSADDLEIADDLAYSLTVDDYDAVERDDLRAEYYTRTEPLRSDTEEIRVWADGCPPIRYDREAVERAGSDRDVRMARSGLSH